MEIEKKVEEKRQGKRAWPYLLSGMAIGSALGVLFAPETGKETRGKVSDWLKEKREQGRRFSLARKHGHPGPRVEREEKTLTEV